MLLNDSKYKYFLITTQSSLWVYKLIFFNKAVFRNLHSTPYANKMYNCFLQQHSTWNIINSGVFGVLGNVH